MSEVKGKTSLGMEQNVEGLLCYVAWWVTGIIFLLLEKDNKFVRFHAIQSIIVFGIITVIAIILGFLGTIGAILGYIVWVFGFILWIVLMVKAYQGQMYKLPVAGDIAGKSSNPSADHKPDETNKTDTTNKTDETPKP
jgi:uncharacterized membrane protein